MIALANFMHASDINTQKVLQLQHEFEKAFNEYLGKTVYMVYILESGNMSFINEVHVGEMYQKAVVDNQAKITATTGYIQKGISVYKDNDLEKEIKELNKRIQKSLIDKKPVFKETMRRYKNNEDEGHMKYNPSYRTFYWWQLRNGKPINKLKGHSDQIINGILYPSRIK
jgi:hypothetical protein